MNPSGAMAQQPPHIPPQQRPQFSHPPANGARDYSIPNGRTSSFGAGSPPMTTSYSSPPPQHFSPPPPSHLQPPSKRPRMSPDAPSPLSNSLYPNASSPPAVSPLAGTPTTATPITARSGPGLMAPPQRPLEREQDRNYNDILSGTGVNIEEEERNLARHDYYNPSNAQSSFQASNTSFGSQQTNSFGQTNGAGSDSFSTVDGVQGSISDEDRIIREHQRADWEAARHSQHALWDMFLSGGTLNERLKKLSNDEHLVDPQTGVLVNTQRNAPPPMVRVNGLEGATRVIDQGQSILDSREKAGRLSDIMKLVSLATQTRLRGLVGASGRLALERRLHSKGQIPSEWADIAVPANSNEDEATNEQDPHGGVSLKRSHSQMDDDSASQKAPSHPSSATFEESMQNARSAEEERIAKRLRRKAKFDKKDGDTTLDAEAEVQAALEAEKKMNKKERKAAETKFSEQQQHKYANEAARMATSGLLGNRFGGKKGKTYSWMSGGAGANAAAVTPTKSTAATPAAGATPVGNKPPAIPRGRRFQLWDEDQNSQITARDILLVLESDGKAARSFVRGSSLLE